MKKTYHVHINQKPHADSLGIMWGCDFRGSPSNSGHIYNVQRIHRTENTSFGVVDWGTCDKWKLWLYLRWLNLRGYRKDEREW
jgi:hypothetical protein